MSFSWLIGPLYHYDESSPPAMNLNSCSRRRGKRASSVFDAFLFPLACNYVLYRRGRKPATCSRTGAGQEQGTVKASERKGILLFGFIDSACEGMNSTSTEMSEWRTGKAEAASVSSRQCLSRRRGERGTNESKSSATVRLALVPCGFALRYLRAFNMRLWCEEERWAGDQNPNRTTSQTMIT